MVATETLRELFNRLRWSPGEEERAVVLTLRVRYDGEEVLETVPFPEVEEVLPAGLQLAGGTFVPYHRVALVRRGDELLWVSRKDRGVGCEE